MLGVHVLWHPSSLVGRARRLAVGAVGFAIAPGLLIAASSLRNRPLLQLSRRFAATITHGEYAEGWSLPWAFFWQAEGIVLVIALAGIGLLLWRSTARGLRWAAAAAAIYAGLVVGSDLLHRFVVYDRLARPMWPFMCLAAAAGFAAVDEGRWLAGRRAFWSLRIVLGLFLINSAPLFTQRYPRDVVRGAGALRAGRRCLRHQPAAHVRQHERLLFPADVPARASATCS